MCYFTSSFFLFFFFNDTATTEIYTLSLHDALPISLLLEQFDDLLIGERVLGVLVRHHFLDLGLDAAGAGVFAGRGGEAAREEELQRQQAARRLDVLLVGHAADGALVHVDDVRHLAQRERLQVFYALLEEL